jgi:hypothetical protein
MAAARTLKTSFWTHPRIRRASSEEKLLAAYLCTCPEGHLCGVFYVALASLSDALQLSSKSISKALDALQSSGFLQFDRETSEVWVCNAYEHQPGAKSPKVGISVGKHLGMIHSDKLVSAFLTTYKDRGYPIDTLWDRVCDTVSIGYRYPSDTDSDTDTDSDPKLDNPSQDRARQVARENALEAIYELYPRKAGKAKGLEALARIAKSGNPEDSLERIAEAAQDMASLWADAGEQAQYCPHFSTWVNGRRWRDPVQEGPRQDRASQGVTQTEFDQLVAELEAREAMG